MTQPDSIRVVGLGGSLAEDSTSLAALKIALAGAVEAGAQVELFDIRERCAPPGSSLSTAFATTRQMVSAR